MVIKGYILNHRTEKYAHKLRVPAANVIDLRKSSKSERKVLSKSQKQPFILSQLLSKLSDTVKSFRLRRQPQSFTQEKVIVSKIQNYSRPSSKNLSENKGKTAETSSRADSQILGRPLILHKSLISFALVCALIISPIYVAAFVQKAQSTKGKVLGISSTAYDYLQKAGSLTAASNFFAASQEFARASESFLQAQKELNELGGATLDLSKLIPNKLKSAEALLVAGENISQAGHGLTSLIDQLEGLDTNPLSENQSSLTDLLSTIRSGLVPVAEQIDTAAENFDQVRVNDLPDEYQATMSLVKEKIPSIRDNLNEFFSISQVLLNILGQEQPKRYLFIFQNNRESRPTGGFIGSIALMDIYQGKIENLEVPGGGIYDVAGQLKEKIIAPKPLWLVNPHWNIQDSNWWPDFPTSAKKLMWFYERTGGTSVDGIISLTPDVIKELLRIVGPIDMQAQYGVTVDEDNFVYEAQKWAEVTYDREENKPKKFIGDMLPVLLDKVFQIKPDNLFKILGVFYNSLSSDDFLLYFSDPTIQEVIHDYGWDGAILSNDKDYLNVISANIGGGKTDHVISQLLDHHVDIKADGSIIDTVTITRVHNGEPQDLWEGVANVAYLRFYVPLGSKLLGASGFTEIPSSRYHLPDMEAVADGDLAAIESNSIIDEKTSTRITDEFGKTVFGNWLSVNPGEAARAVIQYELPFKLNVGGLLDKSDNYSLLIQKQAGIENDFLISSGSVADGFEVLWHSDEVELSANNFKFSTDLDGNKYYGILLNK